jgi:hypothetical protein
MKCDLTPPTGELITVPIMYHGEHLSITARAHSVAEAEMIVLRGYTGATVRRWDQINLFGGENAA